ncbi:hypothetical protein MUK42_33042, partial [Musa troglodytarum]
CHPSLAPRLPTRPQDHSGAQIDNGPCISGLSNNADDVYNRSPASRRHNISGAEAMNDVVRLRLLAGITQTSGQSRPPVRTAVFKP